MSADETSVELVPVDGEIELLDVTTGEVLPANHENAHRALTAARAMKERLNGVIEVASFFLSQESKRLGTKTIHTESGDLVAAGGVATEIDAHELEERLREAGCPEERIREVCVPEVVVKVNRNVLRQLTGSNEKYAAAAAAATTTIEKPLRWSAK